MRKTKFFFVMLLLAFFCLGSGIAGASGGSASDPLVSQSWVDAYVDEQFDSIERQLTEIRKAIAAMGGMRSVSMTLEIGSPMVEMQGSYMPIDEDNAKVVPYIDKNNRTLVPVRFIAEELGAVVGWDAASRKVSITAGATEIEMFIGSTTYYVNGSARTMDTAPVINTGWDRTVVPVRFVAEALGCELDWAPKDAATRYVYITR